MISVTASRGISAIADFSSGIARIYFGYKVVVGVNSNVNDYCWFCLSTSNSSSLKQSAQCGAEIK